MVNLNQFLLPGFEILDWSKGIHLNKVKLERDPHEGPFATVFRYHLRFLLHINGSSNMNLPYYLLKSIEKMISGVKNHPEHSSHSVFHHGLIRILINYEMGKTGRSWQQFIFWSGFEAEI